MRVLALNGSKERYGIAHYAIKIVAEELLKENIIVDEVYIDDIAMKECSNNGANQEYPYQRGQVNIVQSIVDILPHYNGLLLGCFIDETGIPISFIDVLEQLMRKTDSLNEWGPNPAACIFACKTTSQCSSLFQLVRDFLDRANVIIVDIINLYSLNTRRSAQQFFEQDLGSSNNIAELGRKMVWLLQVIDASKETFPAPAKVNDMLGNKQQINDGNAEVHYLPLKD